MTQEAKENNSGVEIATVIYIRYHFLLDGIKKRERMGKNNSRGIMSFKKQNKKHYY